MGKYLKAFLAPEVWNQLESTYADANSEHTWDAFFVMCDLFRQTAKFVGDHFGFNYPEQDDQNVTNYLRHVRNLPSNAETIY
jgi:aminoglycoside 6-adenylyltransferase